MEQYLEKQLHCLCRSVRAADERAVDAAKRHWNGIAKPLYGLGRFEDLLTKVAGIQNTEDIKIDRKAVVVFCADNGVVAEGVTQTDSSVTAVVTENFCPGHCQRKPYGIGGRGRCDTGGYWNYGRD